MDKQTDKRISSLQAILDSIIVLNLEDLRTVMHEILAEYQETHRKDEEEYLTVEETSRILNISTKTRRKYRKMRLIPYVQRGRKIYVKRTDLDAFQEANRIGSKNER